MKKLLSVIFVLFFIVSFAVVGCKKKEEAATAEGTETTESAEKVAQNVPPFKEVARDGVFIAYDNGTVLQEGKGLMWASKDNGKNIKWADAKKYCDDYNGGGYTDWRMPKEIELIGLYDLAKTYKTDCGFDVHMTKLIHLSCFFLWGSNVFESQSPGVYMGGEFDAETFMVDQSTSKDYRVLPVRDAK